MASGHVNRIKRPNTWLHRPMLQNVKKALANPEPSTHGTKRTSQIGRMSASRHKRPIRDGRLGEIKGLDGYGLRLAIERRGGEMAEELSCPPSASGEYRGSSAAPTLQGEAFQFGDNFINDRITDLRQFEAGDPPRSCQ
jgi:hypothetical protein